MTQGQLIRSLSKYGDVQMVKAGYVFTLLLTGTGLSKMETWLKIQQLCTDFCGDKYPVIEVLKTEDTFFLAVLKPKT